MLWTHAPTPVWDTTILAVPALGLPFGEIWDTGARATYWFWLILLGVPTIPVVVLNRLVSRIVSRLTMQSANPPLEPTARFDGG